MLLQVAGAAGGLVLAPLGSNSYCDVRDVLAGILAATERTERPGRRYILAGETAHLPSGSGRIFAAATGGTPPVIPAGPIARSIAGYYGDLRGMLTGHEPDVNPRPPLRCQPTIATSPAPEPAKPSWATIRPLAEASADAWAWFREQGFV